MDFTKPIIYKITAVCTLLVGFISGIVCGNTYKVKTLTYKYPAIKEGEMFVDTFNSALMFGVWISFVVFALIFWAIYCHLTNQETIIRKLEGK